MALLVAVACTDARPSARARVCYDFPSDISPRLVESCGDCHGALRAEAEFRVDSYRHVLTLDASGQPRVSAGDAGSQLLSRAAGGGDHPTAPAALQALLRQWVVECEVSYFATDAVHPLGWVNSRDRDFHGSALRASSWNFSACETCHGSGSDPAGGKSGRSCTGCHEDGPTACNTCHGDDRSSAPPRGIDGAVQSTDPSVGRHRVHLFGGPTLGLALSCDACHVVPKTWRDVGHVFMADGSLDPPGAEVVFGETASLSLAGFDGRRTRPPAYDPESRTCSNVYCHGSVLGDTSVSDPVWTTTPASQADCALCHDNPPAGTHEPSLSTDQCARCHGQVVTAEFQLVAPELHMDGSVTLGDGSQTCAACHGGMTNAAPPRGLQGETSPAALAVGLHQIHLRAGPYRGAMDCADCHDMPDGESFYEAVTSSGHIDTGLPAEVFPEGAATLAATGGAHPNFDRGVASCGNVYCHGGGTTLAADAAPGIVRTPGWLQGAEPMLCGSCHGIPPQDGKPEHAGATLFTCATCHGTAIDRTGAFVFDPTGETLHLNGVVDP
jgi:predicted CxxxxCH...CXXCH cytochrome family protein